MQEGLCFSLIGRLEGQVKRGGRENLANKDSPGRDGENCCFGKGRTRGSK